MHTINTGHLTPSQITEMFTYTRATRAYERGDLTRDQLTTLRFSLSIPVQDIILDNSTYTFEIID
jgi:hypothetical protein